MNNCEVEAYKQRIQGGVTISTIKGIDWKIRFTNPTFWMHISISFFVPIFTHFGYNWNQMTSWTTLFGVIGGALSNPVVAVAVLVSVWNCIIDPTTKGITDCKVKLGQLHADSETALSGEPEAGQE